MILLPLKSDLGDVSRLLGCIVFKGTIGLAPRRFEVVRRSFSMLAPGSDMPPAPLPEPEPARSPVETPGFAAPETGFDGRDAPKRGKGNKRPPYLRLVKSED